MSDTNYGSDGILERLLYLIFKNPLPFKLSFQVPDKEFGPVANELTLNCYLYHIIEDLMLRSNQSRFKCQPGTPGKEEEIFPPLRVRMTYIITAWSQHTEGQETPDIAKEHQLLTEVLQGLARYPLVPEEILPDDVKESGYPVPTTVILPDPQKNPWDFWNAIGGTLRPSLEYNMTLPVSYRPDKKLKPAVRTREIVMEQMVEPFAKDYNVDLKCEL